MNKIFKGVALGFAFLSVLSIIVLSFMGLRLETFVLREFDRKAAIEAAADYQPTILRD